MVCKNCNTAFKDSQKFCSECGAKVIKNRLNPKTLVNQVNEEFFSIDNRLIRTFVHLFTKPEAVINGYINGTRKKYIHVIQYFAIGLTLLGVQVFLMTNVFNDPELYKSFFLESFSNSSSQENNPLKDYNLDDYNSFQSVIYTLTIPISALATWFTFWIVNYRKFNFTEHIVINLYYYAQVVIISAFIYIPFLGFGFNYFTLSLILSLLTFVYLFYVLKRVFQTNFLTSIGHFLLYLAVSAFVFIFIMIIAIIIIVIISI